ncbi:MAG: hypothetical protein ACLFVE_14320, partial [Chitinispirillaceae bacterium]
MNLRQTPERREASVITEGNLTFTFEQHCRVESYDKWSFYRNRFLKIAEKLKAMDIVCLANGTLWLIEVKDYRNRRRTKQISLVEEIVKKSLFTVAGLFAARCNAVRENERTFAARAAKCRHIRVVLHLEQPKRKSKLFPRIADEARLVQELKKR